MNQHEALAIRHQVRIRLLAALTGGRRLDLAAYAKALDLTLAPVTYHCEVLGSAGAVELDGGTAQITASGEELYRISQRPERRQQTDRRRRDRRRE
jgi:hypothetical protein